MALLVRSRTQLRQIKKMGRTFEPGKVVNKKQKRYVVRFLIYAIFINNMSTYLFKRNRNISCKM